MLGAIPYLSPNIAVLLASVGILLIYLELNRPGLVVPGAVGLLLLLLSISTLHSRAWNVSGVLLLAASACIQLVSLRYRIAWVAAIAGGVGTFLGCRHLLSTAHGEGIHLKEALAAGVLLGPGTSLLTAIARRARSNKGLDL